MSHKKTLANSSNIELTKHRACPLCGADDAIPVYSWNDFQFYLDSSCNDKRVDLHTVQCRHCLCVYMNPCYTEDGFKILFEESGGSYSSPPELLNIIPNMLVRNGIVRPGTYVLDAGCYNGRHLAQFPSYVNCIGVDINAPAIAQGKEKYPEFELISSPLESFTTKHPADVIMMLHVLEHLLDPISVLKNLHAMSSPDATLVVEVPIINTIKNQCVVGFFTPHHLIHFSKTTLKNALCRTGWKTCSEDTMKDYNGYRILASKSNTCTLDDIDYDDRQSALNMVNSVNAKANEVEVRINELLTDCDHVSIWGAGMHLEALYQKTTLFHHSRKLEYTIVDASKTLQGSTWRDFPIHAPSVLRDKDWTHDVLIVSSYASTPSIVHDSKTLGIPENKIGILYNEFAE